MTDDTRYQFSTFINTVLNTPSLNLLMQEILEENRLQIVPFLLRETVDPDLKDLDHKLLTYLEEGIQRYRHQYKLHNGYAPLERDIRLEILRLKNCYANAEPLALPIVMPLEIQAPLPPFPPVLPRNRNNREQGIHQFIGECRESKTIISSVDMFNSYNKWCNEHGFGTSSSPTLTKYLRDSDKKHTESVSEKGRSQGWYLSVPTTK